MKTEEIKDVKRGFYSVLSSSLIRTLHSQKKDLQKHLTRLEKARERYKLRGDTSLDPQIHSLYMKAEGILKEVHVELLDSMRITNQFYDFCFNHHKSLLLNHGKSIVNKKRLQKIGITVIKNSLTCNISYFPITNSISTEDIREIKVYIAQNKKTKNLLKKLETFVLAKIKKEIKERKDVTLDEELLNEYVQRYYREKIDLEEFLKEKSKKDEERKEEGASKPEKKRAETYLDLLEKRKREEKLKKQLESFDNYESYFKMSERELKRAKRAGTLKRRKYVKKTRRGLKK